MLINKASPGMMPSSSFRGRLACFGPHCKHKIAAKTVLSERTLTCGLGLISISEILGSVLDFKVGQSSHLSFDEKNHGFYLFWDETPHSVTENSVGLLEFRAIRSHQRALKKITTIKAIKKRHRLLNRAEFIFNFQLKPKPSSTS